MLYFDIFMMRTVPHLLLRKWKPIHYLCSLIDAWWWAIQLIWFYCGFYDSNWMFYAKVSQPNCWALNWCKIVMVGEGRILKIVILVQYFLRWCLNLVLSSPDLRICQLEIIDVMFGWGRSASFVYYFFKNSFNYVLIVLPGADREMTHLVIAVFARNHKIWKWNDWRRSEWTFKSEQGKLSWHS